MIDINLRDCPLCGQKTELFFPENSNLLKCMVCGVVFNKSSMLGKYYYENERVTHVDKKKINSRKRNAKQRVNLIKKILKKESVLIDIGCGEGLFLQEAKNYVNNVYGIEPTKHYATYAKDHLSLDIQQGVIEEIEFPADTFDIVTMFHVLEHLHSPSQTLDRIYSWIKQNGYIVIEVPNIESRTARYKGLNWELIYPEHKFYFSPNSLKCLLEKKHFEIISMRFRDFDQYRISIGKNLRKLGLNFKTLQKKTATGKKVATHNPIKNNISLSKRIRKAVQLPLQAFLGWLVLKFNRGDYLFVIAKKI